MQALRQVGFYMAMGMWALVIGSNLLRGLAANASRLGVAVVAGAAAATPPQGEGRVANGPCAMEAVEAANAWLTEAAEQRCLL